MDDPSNIQKLDYASGHPPAWRRWLRPLGISAALILVVTAIWRYGPVVWYRAAFVYYQRQCFTFTASRELVVFERGSFSSPATPVTGYKSFTGDDYRAITPICMYGYDNASRAGELYGPDQITYIATTPTAFLHERKSPKGTALLLNVGVGMRDVGPITGPSQWSPVLFFEVLSKGSFFDPSGTFYTQRIGISEGTPLDHILRIYAGQPDPVDASHFTIDYDTDDGQRHTWDGWLQDDGTVKIAERVGASTLP